MKKFWNWINLIEEEKEVRTLFLNGTIAEDSWFDDDISPAIFKDELNADTGDISVWINSPGGDCVAAAQIYNMLKDYKGKVTIMIDGLAASAASVIAMAGDKVLMSPVSMMMIHNPATMAFGDHTEMKKTIDMLDEVKESIINAYEIKSGLPRDKISKLMDQETWMNANKAIELGLADGLIEKQDNTEIKVKPEALLFSSKLVDNALFNKISKKYEIEKPKQELTSASEIKARLDVYEKFI